MQERSSVLSRPAAFVAGLRSEAPPPAEAARAAKRCVVDWFAATVPGGVEPPATLLAAALADDLDRGAALLVPSGRRATARTAALVNGAASHTIEFDDIYRDALYHPGSPVIAAALAAAQGAGADGAALLRGVVAGYEVSNRIGVAVNPAHYEYWHTTGTVGTFGAAAAAAAVLGLSAERALHALANAGTFAAGLQQAFRSDAMSKPLHAGRAAEGGLLAALAAAEGVTGAPDILEGPRGFGAAMGGAPDWAGAFADLGGVWTIAATTVKNHGCCGHTFAAIDAALALRAEHGLRPEDVAGVVVGTYGKALEVCGNREPRTAFEAKFSLAYCVAAALLTGRVRRDAFAPERLHDAGLRELTGRVELRVEPEADAAYPRRRAAAVEVTTAAGERLEHRCPTRKGDPDNPLTDEELTDKYLELTEPVLGRARAAALLDRLWRLDGTADLRGLPFGAGGRAAAFAQVGP